MTYADINLREARSFLMGEDPDLDVIEVGIVGGPSHVATGTSYHLGADQLKMGKNPYSARTRRDKAGLADPETRNASCALDVDDDLDELRDMSVWIVNECRKPNPHPDTLDIREIIYSPDGIAVYTWDREQGQTSAPQRRGDKSHLKHTHFSWYRDAVRRNKSAIFRRYFASKQRKKVKVDMWFLQDETDKSGAVYVSNGINTRNVPGGQWELTCLPLIEAGVPFLKYPNMQSLLHAGGPLVSNDPPKPSPVAGEVWIRIPEQELDASIVTKPAS